MARSVILGAGVAGLAAAYHLQRLGEKDPLVLEKNPYPGGLAATMEWNGCRMDLGPHRIHTVYPRADELITEMVGEDLIVRKRTSQIFLDGQWMDYPPRAGEMFRKLGLLTAAKIGLSALQGKVRGLKNKVTGNPPESYGDYLAERFGPYVRELIFDPFALKVYREEADDLDVMVAKVRLASQGIFSMLKEAITGKTASAVKKFRYPKQGMGLISARLQQHIEKEGGEVLLGHEATRIRHTGGLVRSVEFEDPNGEKMSVEASRVITTIPLPILVDLLEPKPNQAVRDAAENLTYADSFLVYTLVNRKPLTPNCWMYFPGDETVFSRVYEICHFSPDMTPEGQSCLCAEIPARPADPVQFVDEEDLKQRVWEGFVETGMAKDAECIDQVVLKIPRAYPIYRKGYKEDLGAILEHLSTLGNLISTGRHGLFHYNNSDHSLEMGRLAAEYARQTPEKSEGWYSKRDEFDRYRIVD
ncbi:MAG: FAD-dependent oxidoreductase [Candidatus Omnitrophica bacterium]|nr:FAD-dependent oxidoreductase [Candidatus Omnitrophota bacterium]